MSRTSASRWVLAAAFVLSSAEALAQTGADASWFWQNPMPQGDDLRSVVMPDAQTVIAITVDSIVKSTDRGATWTVHNVQPTGRYFNLVDLSCTNANTCTAVGSEPSATGTNAIIVRTTDGWATWITTQQSYGPSTILNGVSCPRADTCTAVGSAYDHSYFHQVHTALILRTADGAATWTQQSVGPATFLDGVSCTDANTCMAVGGYYRSAPDVRQAAKPRPLG
jgi:photosystem II stability/assembly factor-like uncharacterized protein